MYYVSFYLTLAVQWMQLHSLSLLISMADPGGGAAQQARAPSKV